MPLNVRYIGILRACTHPWTISTPASLPTLDTGYGRAARRARYKTGIL